MFHKPLSKVLTAIITAVQERLPKYSETAYSRSSVIQMWILKNSKELLVNLQSQSLKHYTNIKTFDFSTLYTTIPHTKLKARLKERVSLCFFNKKGTRRFKYLVLGRNSAYFVKNHTESRNKYTEEDITAMLDFLIDNIFVEFGGLVFQQTIGIPMGTDCAPLLADLFLYSYEAEFIQGLVQKGEKRNKPSLLISPFGILMMYCLLIIIVSVITYI